MGFFKLGFEVGKKALKEGTKTIKSVPPKVSKEARIEWLKKAAKKKRLYSKDYYEGKTKHYYAPKDF